MSARVRRVNWIALYFGVFIVISMIYFCCHFKWAHWIDFLSLFALRPQNDHSYYHVAKAIINNKPNNQLYIGNQFNSFAIFSRILQCFVNNVLNLCIDTLFRTQSLSFFSSFLSFCHTHSVRVCAASCHNALINIQVESLTLSYNNPLVVCLCTSFNDYIINNRLTFAHFPPNIANEFRQPVFNIMLFRRDFFACKSCFKLIGHRMPRTLLNFCYQMSSQLLRHMKSLNP